MKNNNLKISLSIIIVLFAYLPLFALGRNMNGNMSAEWAKTLNRNASTDVDAAFFNPAGTAFLSEGFHIYLGDEVIYQPIKIQVRGGAWNEFALISKGEYKGQKAAWYFPVGHLAFKKDRFSISGWSGGIGGGGVATYNNGLQQFDVLLNPRIGLGNIINSVYNIAGIPGNVIGNILRSKVWASSTIYNIQLNLAYELIKDKLSIAVGGRLLIGNTIIDINLNTIGGSFGTIIPGGSDYHANQLGFAGGAIIGLCFKPVEELTIGITGSWNSPLNLKTKSFQDMIIGMQDSGMKNKGRSAQQLPAEIRIGIAYSIKGLQISSGFMYQLNQIAQWKGKERSYTGGYDVGLGIDYTFGKVPLNIGIGYGWSFSGARPSARDQLHEELNAHSGSFGFTWIINDNMKLTLGEVISYYIPENVNAGANSVLKILPARFSKMSYLSAIGLTTKF